MIFDSITTQDYVLLPIKKPEKATRVRKETARAVIEPYNDEVRIPYVRRDERGDFKALMDGLVDELNGHTKYRFVAINDSELHDLVMLAAPDDARHIKEAVNGFTEETLHEYENDAGEIEPVNTLVGHWEPE